MYAKKILVPVDFSELNETELQYATTLAVDTGAKMCIVHVDEPSWGYGGAGDVFAGMPRAHSESLKAQLEAVTPTDPEVKFEHRLLTGDPAHEIVHFAQREEVDLIVMGTHGRSGLTRLLMGSVAEAVVRRAPCPVFTLKQPHKSAVAAH